LYPAQCFGNSKYVQVDSQVYSDNALVALRPSIDLFFREGYPSGECSISSILSERVTTNDLCSETGIIMGFIWFQKNGREGLSDHGLCDPSIKTHAGPLLGVHTYQVKFETQVVPQSSPSLRARRSRDNPHSLLEYPQY
jgi:hypothetical protein